MYQVIARKYRPQSFDDVVGQEHVKTTLRNAIAQGRIAHGYIFSGQRGTGKTTMARIFARCLNCVEGPTQNPCGVCASCTEISAGAAVDVIEIDAASNRGINEMRELRENVRYQPARGKFKIFIIDEAHQITIEAFNALLKTIEEPPEWAVFILCTTESHKIPATITSRCQHFSFRSVDFDELIGRLRWICEQEGVRFDEGSLAVLAQSGEGSVRDSLSALDQAIACSGNQLEAERVRELLGAFSLDAFSRVAQALTQSNPGPMLDLVDELERNGQNLQHFARELCRYFRNLLVAKIAGEGTRLIAASLPERAEMVRMGAQFSEEDLTRYLQLSLELFKDIQFSLQPRFHLEIGLLRLVHAGRLTSIEKALAGISESLPAVAPSNVVLPQASAEFPSNPIPAPSAPFPVRRGPSPFEADRLKKAGMRDPQAVTSTTVAPRLSGANALAPASAPAAEPTLARTAEPAQVNWQEQLFQGLTALGLTFTADAIAHAAIEANGNELSVKLPQEFKMVANADEFQKAIRHQGLGPVRFKLSFTAGNEGGSGAVATLRAAPPTEDEVTKRALAHPEVQRFREVFGGEVRGVRNLKE